MPEASRSRTILKSCGNQHSVVVTAASAPSHSTEDDKEADFPKGRCCRVYDPICGLVEALRPATVWARRTTNPPDVSRQEGRTVRSAVDLLRRGVNGIGCRCRGRRF